MADEFDFRQLEAFGNQTIRGLSQLEAERSRFIVGDLVERWMEDNPGKVPRVRSLLSKDRLVFTVEAQE